MQRNTSLYSNKNRYELISQRNQTQENSFFQTLYQSALITVESLLCCRKKRRLGDMVSELTTRRRKAYLGNQPRRKKVKKLCLLEKGPENLGT